MVAAAPSPIGSNLARPAAIPLRDRVGRGLQALERRVRSSARQARAAALGERVAEEERLSLTLAGEVDLTAVPASGPVLVLADSDLGAVAGRTLWRLLRQRRPDCLVLARERSAGRWLTGRPDAPARLRWRSDPRSAALRWARRGGLVLVLAEAEDLGALALAWARSTPAAPGPCLPLALQLDRGPAAGTHARLRIGRAIAATRLAQIGPGERLRSYLELRLRALETPRRGALRRGAHSLRQRWSQMARVRPAPVAAQADPRLLAGELDRLPRQDCLAAQGELEVWLVSASQAPWLLHEVGRLRELTFRAVGEGTGRPLDLDRFDATYRHLVVVSRAASEVVGAYRFLGTDEALARGGPQELYTHTLFQFDASILRRIGPALELGRSFVRAEHQRSYAPLLLLWRAIGAYVVANPRYRHLFGAVSITADYQPLSRALLVEYLETHCLHREWSAEVRSRQPLAARTRREGRRFGPGLGGRDLRELSELIAEIERDQRGVPTLLRAYLDLGGRVLEFNVDRDFNDALDALLVVDLLATERRVLGRYLTPEGAERLHRFHAEGGVQGR
jgi:putative hemolysin